MPALTLGGVLPDAIGVLPGPRAQLSLSGAALTRQLRR